mgnify:CR=1 FL=1|tara:strand:+ start:370 stop:552 length:183 start_codon:yes stop_codon:yes gene_type:complete
MFSLIAVVCQGFTCITFTPPKVYSTEMACMEDAIVLYNVVRDIPEREIIDMHCYEWQDKV